MVETSLIVTITHYIVDGCAFRSCRTEKRPFQHQKSTRKWAYSKCFSSASIQTEIVLQLRQTYTTSFTHVCRTVCENITSLKDSLCSYVHDHFACACLHNIFFSWNFRKSCKEIASLLTRMCLQSEVKDQDSIEVEIPPLRHGQLITLGPYS